MLNLVFSSSLTLNSISEFNCAYQNTHSDVSCTEKKLISKMSLMPAVVSAVLVDIIVVFHFLVLFKDSPKVKDII